MFLLKCEIARLINIVVVAGVNVLRADREP